MRVKLFLNLSDLVLEFDVLPALLGNLGLKTLDLELDRVQLYQQLRVLLRPLLYVVLSTSLILNGVDLEGGNGPLHVPELAVKFLKGLRVLFAFAKVLVGRLRHHVVLIKFHNPGYIGLLVLGLHDLVDVLSELHDSLLLFGGGLPLLLQIQMTLVDLGLFLGEFFAELVHPLHLTFENLFKVKKLIF